MPSLSPTSHRMPGRVDPRAPGGVELAVTDLQIIGTSPEFPITPKEHGTDFLMDNRHLWLRSKRQHAILRVLPQDVKLLDTWRTAGVHYVSINVGQPGAAPAELAAAMRNALADDFRAVQLPGRKPLPLLHSLRSLIRVAND